jgi:hypothetical protein
VGKMETRMVRPERGSRSSAMRWIAAAI